MSRSSLLRILAVLLGLSLLPLAEGTLRLTGAFDSPIPRLPDGAWSAGSRGSPMLVEQDGRVRPDPDQVRGGFMHDLDFPLAPTPGIPRIVCFGGSSTLGVPVEATPERAFPGRLAHHLGSAGFPAEVINLGGASFGSDQVRQLVEAVLPYQPDALVIYSANNEYFNFNLRLYEQNRRWYATRLEGLHLMRALRHLLGQSREAAPDAAVATQEMIVEAAILDGIAAGDAWPTVADGVATRTDPIAATVTARYRDNLAAIAELTAASGVPVLIAQVPANLAEPPWLSAPPADVQTCEEAETVVRRSPASASGWYTRGICAQRAGAPVEQWSADLKAALELDLNPGRPPAALQAAPEAVAADWPHVHAISLDPLFGAEADPPYGLDLFHDSCHLTPAGYDRLGRHLALALIRHL